MDNVKGSLICDNLCSNISTVLITSNACLAQDGQEIILTPRFFKFKLFNISSPALTSFIGSYEREILIVSPIPSLNNIPIPIEDLIVPVK